MIHKESILPRNKAHGCYCGGIANWRVAIVHYVAKAVGLHIKLEGMPIGTSRNLERLPGYHGQVGPGAFSQGGSTMTLRVTGGGESYQSGADSEWPVGTWPTDGRWS